MMRALLKIAAATLLALSLSTPASAQTFGVPFKVVTAWTPMSGMGVARWPTSGTYDVSGWKYIGGPIGLDPQGTPSRGVVVFRWTSDQDGNEIVGVQGIHLTSLIPSANELRLLNRGPYLWISYQAYSGPNGLSARLYGTDAGATSPHLTADTIQIDEQDKVLGANGLVTVYPADYFAGWVRVYLEGDDSIEANIQAADLEDHFWILEKFGPGRFSTIVPMGTWAVIVRNKSTVLSKPYTLSVTQLVTW